MNQNKVYVGNLPYSTTSDDLRDLFSQYGEVLELKLITDYEGRSKGFGFVTFNTQEAAQASLVLDGAELQGRKLKVNIARDKEEGRRGGGGGGRPFNKGKRFRSGGSGGGNGGGERGRW